MKRRILFISFLFLTVFLFAACDRETEREKVKNPYDMFTFTHYASGGTPEEETAVILFEQSNATFTAYQVAFVSCTCRDPSVNYYSVMYIELLNTKETPEEAAIRAISFKDNMGMFGDSNPTYGTDDHTPEYYDEHFIQPLVGKTKADFDAWGGYKTQIEGIDVDAVTGASVTTSNVTSCIKSLFEYHTDKYYADKAAK